MSFTKLNRPPKDLDSFLGRKWLERLATQNDDLSTIVNLPFLLTAPSATLPNSRGVSVSPTLSLTDSGAGGSLTFALSPSVLNLPFTLTAASATFPNSRGLAASPAITLTDGGAGGNLTFGLDYNTTNLKLTASKLNTIQDIATSSSPTFANLTLSGDLLFSVDGTSSIGSASTRPKLIHIGGATGGAINTNFRGFKLSGANADYYIGDDNVSPGFYAQRSVVKNSTSSDYTTDYSNLFQGDSTYQYLALNFGITRSLGVNGVVIGDNGSGEGCSLIIGTSTTRRMEMYFDYANKTFVMDGNLTAGTAANKCMKMKIELGATAPAIYPATDNKIDFGIASTNRWKDYYGMTATLSTSLTLSAMTSGSIIFAGTSGLLSQDNANFFWDNTNKRLGLFTTAPTNALSLGGNAARVIAMERHTTANTAGNALTIQAGGATSGATNRAGGSFTVKTGQSTGSAAGGNFIVQTTGAGTAGTSDNSYSTRLSINGGTGACSLTSVSSGTAGHTGLSHTVNGGALNLGSILGQDWNYGTTSQIDSTVQGLHLTLGSTVITGDTGGSNCQGFAFELYCNTDVLGTTHPGGTAVGGFMQSNGPGPTTSMEIFLAQTNIVKAAGTYKAFSSLPNLINAGITLTDYYGLHVQNFASNLGGTITNTYGVKIDDLTVDNANAYALYCAGGKSVHVGTLKLGDTTAATEQLEFADAKNIKFQTTTGTKIATATSQKLSFWNATPIIQPTTGVAGATFVAGAGTAVNDASTFDGYTIKQVVKALRNIGLLA